MRQSQVAARSSRDGCTACSGIPRRVQLSTRQPIAAFRASLQQARWRALKVCTTSCVAVLALRGCFTVNRRSALCPHTLCLAPQHPANSSTAAQTHSHMHRHQTQQTQQPSGSRKLPARPRRVVAVAEAASLMWRTAPQHHPQQQQVPTAPPSSGKAAAQAAAQAATSCRTTQVCYAGCLTAAQQQTRTSSLLNITSSSRAARRSSSTTLCRCQQQTWTRYCAAA